MFEGAHFKADPVVLDDGIALTEEAVEKGKADIAVV